MAPNNFQKEEKYQFPYGPLPPGYIFKLSAFRQLDKGLNIRPSSAKENFKYFLTPKIVKT